MGILGNCQVFKLAAPLLYHFDFCFCFSYQISHRGLKLDGALGQGEICNSLKIEKFSKSFLSHIGKNKIKF